MVSFSLNNFMLNRKIYGGCLIWPTLYKLQACESNLACSIGTLLWYSRSACVICGVEDKNLLLDTGFTNCNKILFSLSYTVVCIL